MPSQRRVRFQFARFCYMVCRYLPRSIYREEIVVRAIFSPFHVDKLNKLKIEAFDPTPGTDEISVMRSSFIGSHRCKQRAQLSESPTHKKVFKGFAVLEVKSLQAMNLSVHDSRKGAFVGHAHIATGEPVLQKGMPRSPEQLERRKALNGCLIRLSKYCPDPLGSKVRWEGAPLSGPSSE